MMRKIFAMILAVLMLLSVIPTGFAATSNYHADHKFGYDSWINGRTVSGATVSVGGTTLTEGNASSTNAAAVSGDVTISFVPGYYLNAYKIVCGDKYSCQTDARGQATKVTNVMSGATKTSYTVDIKETDLAHTSNKGPYWILLDIQQDKTPYLVSYNWGELNGVLDNAAPATETYLVNAVVTVKAGSDAALAEAEALGYRFVGWKKSVTNVTRQPGYQFGMPSQNVTMTAQWEIVPITISGSKTWNDNNDQDGKRPESITINLLANGVVKESKTVTAADGWAWSFSGLYKSENGVQITYTITEGKVDGYTAVVNGYNVTNTHTPETTSVSGAKTWNDNNDQDGKRPASITIKLMNGETVVATKTVTAADGWAWEFTNLPKYAAGVVINYTIAEEAVEGYTSSVNGYNVTNTHTPEKTSVSGSKTWNDADNQDGKRPESITINLLADGVKVDSKVVTAADNWAWSFTGLDKYKAGKEIAYTITEDAVDEYTTAVNGYNVTNTHTPEKTSVSGAKTWNDANDQDGIRPDSITINLLADGVKVDSKTVGEADNWAWTFNDLDKYANGTEITYTITEEAVEGYTAAVDGFNVTNTHVPATTEVSGSKIWDDAGNQDGIRPASITINLLADGVKVDSKVVTAEDNWAWSFTNLPLNKAGVEIKYTVTEEAVEGYTTVIDGYNVTNTHTPAVITVSGTKTWDDADDQDGIRPKSITVNLLANGEKVDSVEVKAHLLTGKWEYTFENLPKFENGVKIEYTVEEVPVDGYTATVNGFDITNTHTPATTEVSGSKTWNDADNQDGIRPESITINLLANGKKVDSKVVTAADEWKWSFTDLPKNEDGKKITYTITEEKVEGYTGTVLGFNVVNVHIPETITISGDKTWDDADDQDGIRPDSITVNLLANGEKVASVEVKAGLFGTWKYSFKDMPKYENGKEIVYTVEEEAVEGYTATVEGFDITNCHEPDETELTVKKVWDDKKDENKKRPDSVKVTLYANGKSTGKTLTLSAANGWTGTFQNLAKNDDGKAIKYTIKEASVSGYKASYSYSGTTATVTNTFSDIPVTGDTSGVLGFAMIMTVSAAALVVLAILGKRKFQF